MLTIIATHSAALKRLATGVSDNSADYFHQSIGFLDEGVARWTKNVRRSEYSHRTRDSFNSRRTIFSLAMKSRRLERRPLRHWLPPRPPHSRDAQRVPHRGGCGFAVFAQCGLRRKRIKTNARGFHRAFSVDLARCHPYSSRRHASTLLIWDSGFGFWDLGFGIWDLA